MSELLARLRAAYAEAGDPAKAPQMQAYMKSAMPFHGVPTPARRKITKELLRPVAFADRASWEKQVRALWRGAKFREERYAALQLAADRRARAFQVPEALALYEELVVTGAWWDFVDEISNLVGDVVRAHPGPGKKLMRKWARDADFWKRRVSIICQRKWKRETDLSLLYDCIEPSLGSKEFFLQKAIGWALREIAWWNPGEVRRYVAREKRLAALSRREALKNLK